MAGWSKVTTDGPAFDCFRTLQEIHKSGSSLKCGEIGNEFTKLFNQIVSRFLKEICHSSCFRPLPPMLGDNKPIDLLKLYLSVREKGGYDSVSNNGYWDLVAKEIGFDSNDSAGLKLVYVKYLELLEDRFCKMAKDKGSSKGRSFSIDLKFDSIKRFSDVDVDDSQNCVGSVEGNEEDDELNRKRKRECYLPLLDWVKRVSKNPCDPAIGSLPERLKWKNYGSDNVWKQVLMAREAMLLKVNVDLKVERTIWQKKLKMHPSMYEDQTNKSTSRCSQRLISAKEAQLILPSTKPHPQEFSESSSTSNPSDKEDEDSFWGLKMRRKQTPLGRYFQAKIPDWAVNNTYEPDTRYLGSPIWPLEKNETQSSLIELERIGRGSQDSCACHFPGSLECVKFHINKKRIRVRLELGSAFFKWKFDEMGENVALKWTRPDEKKFEDIIRLTPASSGMSFWDEILSCFKHKTMQVLVSYYFNVYLLRRRADQNRSDPSNIDSDDDELEKVGNEASDNANGSILCSLKKAHLNGFS